jgi:hypothetical protein
MEFSRNHHRLFSIAVSAMLTSAFLATAPGTTISAAAAPQPQALMQAFDGLRNAGFKGLSNVALPPPTTAPTFSTPVPVDPAGAGLTDNQLKKLDGFMPKFGLDVTLVKMVSDALGITHGAETLTIRELAIGDAPNPKHAFSRIASGGYLYILATSADARSYYIDTNQSLIAAVVVPANSTTPVAIPVALAQTQLKDEFAFWAKTVGN